MRRCVIVGGASIGDYEAVGAKLRPDDYMIYCDCGLRHMDELGTAPDLIVGDFDSYSNPGLDAETIILPCEKDDTDTEIAMHKVFTLGCSEVVILGAFGGRMDHCVANIQLLKLALDRGVRAYLVDVQNRMCLIKERTLLRKEEQYGKYVSFLPFTDQVQGITLTGYKYPLDNYTMVKGPAFGVSNEIEADVSCVEIKNGILLMIQSRD